MQDFSGADPFALMLLAGAADYDGGVGMADYGGVGMADYVGDEVGAPPRFDRRLARRPGGGAQAARLKLLAAHGMQALRAQHRQQQDARLRRAALAGYIPQFDVPITELTAFTGGTTLQGSPGVPCRLSKYTVEPAVASFFVIEGITVARINMISGGLGGIPASRFSPLAIQVPIDCPEVGAGSPISVNVTNIDGATPHVYVSSFQAVDLTSAQARLT